ncbi:hypothetical protein BDV95DRAFT_579899 [Massariosphaeria phaeospora]|uniref:Uncharacterized protein n=1 Tax=Massariosphaeria phaeospora TaxID=100035 RepID=A0A7C8M840_9PLEO|nr:hypothetical protein BDV95DRAFT_579899 [Massariosphaeria phaeospora]
MLVRLGNHLHHYFCSSLCRQRDGTELPGLTSPLETPPIRLWLPANYPEFPSFQSARSSFSGRRPSSTLGSDAAMLTYARTAISLY